MFEFGFPELLIVLVIVALVFGPGRLAKMMGEIGSGIRSFREALAPQEQPTLPAATDTAGGSSSSKIDSTEP